MYWLLLWIVLSVPIALFLGAFIASGDDPVHDPELVDDALLDLHEQTIVS